MSTDEQWDALRERVRKLADRGSETLEQRVSWALSEMDRLRLDLGTYGALELFESWKQPGDPVTDIQEARRLMGHDFVFGQAEAPPTLYGFGEQTIPEGFAVVDMDPVPSEVVIGPVTRGLDWETDDAQLLRQAGPALLSRCLRLEEVNRRLATDGPRASQLADRCQVLEDELRAKRAQCDELRDRLEADRG